MPALPYIQQGLRNPGRTAITDAAGAWTYADLAVNIDSASACLAGGASTLDGERIGLFLDPTKESIAAYLGVLEAGGIAVPLSIHATAREIAYQISDAGITRAVTDAAYRDRLTEAASAGSPTEVIDQTSLFQTAASAPSTPPDLTAPATILYTSGTTGQPKGVVHTHASVINQVNILAEAWGWSDDDRLLHALPLHHVHGLINGALGALWAGAGLHLLRRFEAADVWGRFAAGEATVFYAVPTIYHQLLEAWQRQDEATQQAWVSGVQSMRLLVSGSAALPATLWQRWRDVTGSALLERYGMTEIGMALSNPYDGERRAGTVGQPLPTMEMRLVDEDGIDSAPGEPGEIWVRGASVFTEYWRKPEATRESFRDGYFLTGDIAEIQDGYVRILGRASADIIKSGGYKLSALEIEEVVLGHPAVSEVAVVGAPNEEWGEVVTACIVLRENATLTVDELRTWCADKLSPYKQPRRLQFYDALPRNAMGKVVKPTLKESLTAD